MGERGAGPQPCCRGEAHRLCRGCLAAPSIGPNLSGNLRRRNNFLATSLRWRRPMKLGGAVVEMGYGRWKTDAPKPGNARLSEPFCKKNTRCRRRRVRTGPRSLPWGDPWKPPAKITVRHRTMGADYPPSDFRAIPALSRQGFSRIGRRCEFCVRDGFAPLSSRRSRKVVELRRRAEPPRPLRHHIRARRSRVDPRHAPHPATCCRFGGATATAQSNPLKSDFWPMRRHRPAASSEVQCWQEESDGSPVRRWSHCSPRADRRRSGPGTTACSEATR